MLAVSRVESDDDDDDDIANIAMSSCASENIPNWSQLLSTPMSFRPSRSATRSFSLRMSFLVSLPMLSQPMNILWMAIVGDGNDAFKAYMHVPSLFKEVGKPHCL